MMDGGHVFKESFQSRASFSTSMFNECSIFDGWCLKRCVMWKVNSLKNPRRPFYNCPSPKVYENGLVLFINVETVVMIFFSLLQFSVWFDEAEELWHIKKNGTSEELSRTRLTSHVRRVAVEMLGKLSWWMKLIKYLIGIICLFDFYTYYCIVLGVITISDTKLKMNNVRWKLSIVSLYALYLFNLVVVWSYLVAL